MIKIVPLGGLGEIGLNMMAMEYEGTLFVIDAGLMFPEDYMLGVDLVIPDFSYLKQNIARISGIVLTHAHEDHIGALPYLLKAISVPVFGTPFTIGIVRHKLEEHGLLGSNPLHEILPGEILRLGPFRVEFIRVCHSVVDGVGLAVHTPIGTVIHTGDFKISYSSIEGMMTDVGKFAQYGDRGVLALLSDSTNVEREGYTISDREVGNTLGGPYRRPPGPGHRRPFRLEHQSHPAGHRHRRKDGPKNYIQRQEPRDQRRYREGPRVYSGSRKPGDRGGRGGVFPG
jgi:ribonuclease J